MRWQVDTQMYILTTKNKIDRNECPGTENLCLYETGGYKTGSIKCTCENIESENQTKSFMYFIYYLALFGIY